MSSWRDKFFLHLAQTSESPIGLEVVHAEGSWLVTRDGRKYLDFISGIGVSNLGHGRREILDAIRKQAERYLHVMVYGEYVLDVQVALASRLVELFPSSIDQVYFTNSGAEAIEGALKTARKYTGRKAWAAFEGAYHGDTLGALALAGNAHFRAPFEPLPGPVVRLKYNDVTSLSAIDETLAAVVVEPVQAEAGVRIPTTEFMQELRRQCDNYGVLLVFDEVLTGFGRTGRLFALDHFGVTPDIIVLAKALGGGLPLGAFCASNKILGVLAKDPPLGHITTFGGHPLSCAAGLAALEFLVNNQLWKRAAELGTMVERRLSELVDGENITAVRGIGLLIGIEFAAAPLARAFTARSIQEGVVVNWTLNADNVVRLAPPLTIGDDEVEFALDAMRKAAISLAEEANK